MRADFPLLRHELASLQGKLAEESRTAQRALRSISQDIYELNGANEALTQITAELPEETQTLGFVYLIGHFSALKIGWTKKHLEKRRFAELQTGTEQTPELLGFVLGTAADERGIHQRFSQHRIRGEWFEPAQEILAYFQENYP